MNKNDVTSLLQSSQNSAEKLKALQNGFDALGRNVNKVADTFFIATQSMNQSLSALDQGMVQLSISAASLTNAVSSMAMAMTSNAEVQMLVQGAQSGTISSFEQIQTKTDKVKANFLGLTGSLSGLLGAFLDAVPITNELISLYQTLAPIISDINLKVIKTTVSQKAANVVQLAGEKATKMLAAAQKAWNLVMSSGPIGLLITAVGGLVLYLVQAYNTFDDFREIVDSAWDGVKKLGKIIGDELVNTFEKFASVIQPIWEKLKVFLGIEEEAAAITQKVTEDINGVAKANGNASVATATLNGILQDQNKLFNTNLNTLGGVEQKISDLRTAQKSATGEQAIALEKEIRLWEKKQKAMENAILIGAATPPVLTPLVAPENKGIDLEKAGATNPKVGEDGKVAVVDSADLKTTLSDLEKMRGSVEKYNKSIWGSNSTIGQWANNTSSEVNRMSIIFKEFGVMLKNDTLSTVQQVSGGLQAMGAMMGTMGGMVDGAAGSWLSWGANVLGTIANALPELLKLFGVQCAVAAAGAATSVASIPVVGWIMAGVAIASVVAALASIPKPKAFANGGIVYGNTFAQVGEYPGAANNPEVIAPLSKLKNLLSPQGFGGGTVEFVIKGNRLVGVMNKENEKGRYF